MNSYVKTLIGLVMVMVTLPALAQTKAERKANRQLERVNKKQERLLALEENHQYFLDLVQNQTFTIEANELVDRYGRRAQVSSNINFVAFEGSEAVVQYGFNHRIGFNGLGGNTFDGRISSYNVKEGKKNGTITVTGQFISNGLLGASTLNMNIFDDGRARATIITAFGSRLTFSGYINDLETSRVYKGLPRI